MYRIILSAAFLFLATGLKAQLQQKTTVQSAPKPVDSVRVRSSDAIARPAIKATERADSMRRFIMSKPAIKNPKVITTTKPVAIKKEKQR